MGGPPPMLPLAPPVTVDREAVRDAKCKKYAISRLLLSADFRSRCRRALFS